MSYQPNPQSELQPGHLQYFRLAGRFCALCLLWETTMNVHFTRSMYKLLTGEQLVLADLESVDRQLYNSLMWIAETEELEDMLPGQCFTIQREVCL